MQGLCKGTGQRSELTDSILLTIDTTGLSPEDARPLFFVYILQISKNHIQQTAEIDSFNAVFIDNDGFLIYNDSTITGGFCHEKRSASD